jgi:hypothetical protein
MYVRISEKGREVLNDKELAEKVVKLVIEEQEELSKGHPVPVDEHWNVRLTTTIKENFNQEMR